MIRRSLVVSALTAILFVVDTAPALGLQYTYLEDTLGNEALVRERGFEAQRWFKVTIDPFTRTPVASTTNLHALTSSQLRIGRSANGEHFLIANGNATNNAYSYSKKGHVNGEQTSSTHTLSIDIRRAFLSPEGTSAIATSKQRGIFTVDFTNNTATNIGTMPSGASWITASPNTRYIAYYIPGTQKRGERTFGVFDAETKSHYTYVEKISYWDLLTEGITIFAFSPDSKTLLYLSDRDGFTTPYIVDLTQLSENASMKGTRPFTREYTVADVAWDSADSFYFIANRTGPYQWSLYHYSLANETLRELDTAASFGANLMLTQSHLLYGRADATGVYPVARHLVTGSTTVLTSGSSTTLPLPKSKSVTLAGNLKGVYFIEPSKKSNTLVVWLHGGPYRQTSSGYNPYWGYGSYDAVLEAVRLTDVGILKIDYPGSAGHGRKFAESVTGNVGVIDSKKTTAAVQAFAKKNGYTNVYLVGNSYGGYLALKMLVDTPKAFKGSMSIGGVTDWTTLLTKLNDSIFNVQFSGLADEKNYKLHAAASIYNSISKVAGQKIVLVHGEKDATIPLVQATSFSTYLTSLQKPHQLIVMPGEDHVFKKKASFESLCVAITTLVDRASTSTCAFTDLQ